MPTEMLKLVIEFSLVLQVMKSSTSGWSTRSTAMLAPRRRAALGDLAKGVVVDAQETHRAGGLAGGGFHQGAGWAQAREGEAVAAAGLLDQGGIAQGLEDAGRNRGPYRR